MTPALDQAFAVDRLYALRSAVAAHAADLGAGRLTDEVVIVAHELASNAVRHGGGRGRLWLWREALDLHCRVADAGPGLAEPVRAGLRRTPAALPGGRGLFIVRRLVARLDIHTDPTGTTVTAVIPLERG